MEVEVQSEMESVYSLDSRDLNTDKYESSFIDDGSLSDNEMELESSEEYQSSHGSEDS
jgi:hypothetical protein